MKLIKGDCLIESDKMKSILQLLKNGLTTSYCKITMLIK